MPGLISPAYRLIKYYMLCLFWNQEIIETVLTDRMSRYDISPVDINNFMDSHNIPYFIGRFPEVCKNHKGLVAVALQEIDEFSRKIEGKKFNPEQKAKMLMRRVALKMYHSW